MLTHVRDVCFLAFQESWRTPPPLTAFFQPAFVTDGRFEVNENTRMEKGVGGDIPIFGIVEPTLEITGNLGRTEGAWIPPLFPKAFYPNGAPRNWRPTLMAAIVGNPDVAYGGNPTEVLVYDMCPTEIRLEARSGEPARYTLRFTAASLQNANVVYNQLLIPTKANPMDLLYWYYTGINIQGYDLLVTEFTFTVRQDVRWHSDVSTPKAAGWGRYPVFLSWGLPEVTVSLRCVAGYPFSLATDLPTPIDMVVDLGYLSIALVDLVPTRWSFPVQGGDELWEIELEFVGMSDCYTVTWSPP